MQITESECLCAVLSESTDFKKGKFNFLNFYLKGLPSTILKELKKSKYKKILIKNNINCFLPEKLLFYYKEKNIESKIIQDMKNLKIEKFIIFKWG